MKSGPIHQIAFRIADEAVERLIAIRNAGDRIIVTNDDDEIEITPVDGFWIPGRRVGGGLEGIVRDDDCDWMAYAGTAEGLWLLGVSAHKTLADAIRSALS